MTEPIASLPMYDADRGAVEAWWRGIASALQVQARFDLASASFEWPADLEAHWRDPRLLLSQTCGFPLMTALKGAVQVVGAFRYAAPGCAGIDYRSELMARCGDGDGREGGEGGGGAIERFRGRVVAINAVDSHSGSNALLALVAPLAIDGAFFGGQLATGSHRRSLEAVRSGAADIAAIDGVTLAGFRRHAPELLVGLEHVGSTAPAPGLPLITSATTTPAELHALQTALAAACRDPALAAVREALFIGGFEIATASQWQVVEAMRLTVARAFGSAAPAASQPARTTPPARAK